MTFNPEQAMNHESRYLLFTGISLTLVMATTLFALMGINPKLSSYEYLPWVYSASCASLAVITGWIARRCNRLAVAESAAIVVNSRTDQHH